MTTVHVQGDLISSFVHRAEPHKQSSFLAETGLNLYLQMLLKDNFCHADLHPGRSEWVESV